MSDENELTSPDQQDTVAHVLNFLTHSYDEEENGGEDVAIHGDGIEDDTEGHVLRF